MHRFDVYTYNTTAVGYSVVKVRAVTPCNGLTLRRWSLSFATLGLGGCLNLMIILYHVGTIMSTLLPTKHTPDFFNFFVGYRQTGAPHWEKMEGERGAPHNFFKNFDVFGSGQKVQ